MKLKRVLLLAGAADHLTAVSDGVASSGLDCELQVSANVAAVRDMLGRGTTCVVVADNASEKLLELVLAHAKSVPTLVISNGASDEAEQRWRSAGVVDIANPGSPGGLAAALRHLGTKLDCSRHELESTRRGTLVDVVQQLSSCRSMAEIMLVTRTAIREVMGAQGAAFILRDGDTCHYADEDAILPLWKGQRFPMGRCIGGQSMLTRAPVIVEDVFEDDRIPREIYEPTFVRSLAVLPIRTANPIGAIGAYWEEKRQIPSSEVALLQALANATSLAIQNVKMQDELEQRVNDRTTELQQANEELDAFASSVSHDLRNRLNSVHGYTSLLELHAAGQLNADAARCLATIKSSSVLMLETISALLALSRASRQEIVLTRIDATAVVQELVNEIQRDGQYPSTAVDIADGLAVMADAGLIRTALENVLSNAFKYSSKAPSPAVQVGMSPPADGYVELYVRDNGAGFDPARSPTLFKPFGRLHSEVEFPGTGIGLTIVRRAIERCGGQVRIEGSVGGGATVYLRLRSAGS